MADIQMQQIPEKTTNIVSWDKTLIIDSEDSNKTKVAEALKFIWPQGIQGLTWPQGIKWDTWLKWDIWPQGIPWIQGLTWNWIQSITLSSTVWKVKTYRITYTDWITFDYDVTDWDTWAQGIPWISWWKWSDWVFAYDYHTATANQTVFTLTYSYTSWENNLYVFINWVKQTPVINYTETDNNTVTFTTWLNVWDAVEFINPNKWLNWKGSYDMNIHYLKDDAVYYNWNSYICISPIIWTAPWNTTYWNSLFDINNYISPVVRWKIVASAWQTAFTVPKYTSWRIQVYVNWALQLVTDNYTETNNTTITFVDWLSNWDIFNYIII